MESVFPSRCIRFASNTKQAFRAIERILTENNVEWIIPDRENWRIDVEELYEAFPELPNYSWLSGAVAVAPEFEQTERDSFGTPSFDAAIRLYLTERELVHMPPHLQEPVEIHDSIRRFREDQRLCILVVMDQIKMKLCFKMSKEMQRWSPSPPSCR